ncbi:hypothetical protein FD755_024260, partial [Muntiacus reevesi]
RDYLGRQVIFYAQVTKMLGNARLEAVCFDGVTRICHIRGSLRKTVWINTSDIILIGLRDYQHVCLDSLVKYSSHLKAHYADMISETDCVRHVSFPCLWPLDAPL